MNLKVLVIFFMAASFLFDANAGEIEMSDSNICNGYTQYSGVVMNVIATTTYDGEENVYANIKMKNQEVMGGVIYYRAPYQAGYIPMVNLATIASVTGVRATFCMKERGNEIYAIKLEG
ncbi:hypothetical protein CMV60_15445 [Serratia marcescens]|nr:hypothetical protein CMV60_15445 [Serratia marcescens]